MAVLRDMGIIAPRIVDKVVKARNYLEHKYQAPVQEQVEDALDIATLFVTSLDRALHFFQGSYEIGTLRDDVEEHDYLIFDKALSISFNGDKPQFILRGYVLDPSLKSNKGIGQAFVMPKDKGYLDIIKLALRVEKANDLEAEASRLISLLAGGK
jgi:hypothetical protein